MPRKLTPVVHTLVAATPKLLNTGIKRESLLISNETGADLGLTSNSAETSVANCYIVSDGVEHFDRSNSNIYGVSAAGGTVRVWEEEK